MADIRVRHAAAPTIESGVACMPKIIDRRSSVITTPTQTSAASNCAKRRIRRVIRRMGRSSWQPFHPNTIECDGGTSRMSPRHRGFRQTMFTSSGQPLTSGEIHLGLHASRPSRGALMRRHECGTGPAPAGVVRSCTPGRTPEQPRQLLRAGPGPGAVERESGKSRWRAGQARSFFWRLLWRATPPRFWGKGKETGKPQARPKLGPTKHGCMTIEYNGNAYTVLDRAVCADRATYSVTLAPRSGERVPSAAGARRVRGAWRKDSQSTAPCMVGRPNRRKLKGASGPVATDPDADGRDRGSPSVTGTVGEHGPSVLRLLSSTDDREHVPHARQGSV